MRRYIREKLISMSKTNRFIRWLGITLKNIERRKYRLGKRLVRRGETSQKSKEKIVKSMSVVWRRHIKRLNPEIAKVYMTFLPSEKADNLQYVNQLTTDIIFCNLAYGFMPDEYMFFRLEKRSPSERKKFISNRDKNDYIFALNDFHDKYLFFDKYEMSRIFSKYFGRDAIKISSESDYDTFAEFVLAHNYFVKKPLNLSGGRGIELFTPSMLSSGNLRTLFNELVGNGPYIVEERIKQGEEMSALHPHSVNTIRCNTLVTSAGVKMLHSFVKIGRNKSFVDNGALGGILASLDLETGQFSSHGADEIGNYYERHPDTGVVIKGFQLPGWGEALNIAKELAQVIPSVRYVGWDLAYTEKGWIMVEGNSFAQFVGQQIPSQAGIKEEMEDIIKAYL